MLNRVTLPNVMTFGITKAASAYAIRSAAENELYEKEGMKFYYADESDGKGGPVIPPSAEEAGRVYVELSERNEQGSWNYVYVAGKGEVKL